MSSILRIPRFVYRYPLRERPVQRMTPARNRRIRELFDAAISLPPEGQAELLWRECGDDEDLVRAVWRLLGANRKSDGFLSAPLFRNRPAVGESFGLPGSTIGPYKIVRELGAGGMGIVYQTVRADQVFRRVMALKVIRPDFVTDRLIAGFEQERRILGDLDHPHIARILDGGSTEQGLALLRDGLRRRSTDRPVLHAA